MIAARRLFASAVLVCAVVCAPRLADAVSVGASFPVHGTVLAAVSKTSIIAAIDGVPRMYAARTARFTLPSALPAGTAFDAYLDPGRSRLADVHAAAAFVPGLPSGLITHIMARGDALPPFRFVTQDGRAFSFPAQRGKVVLLSFVYTRCPDVAICPAISGKFAYLQHRLDPRRFRLVELTLDPLADSPRVLAAYGRQFGAPAFALVVDHRRAR